MSLVDASDDEASSQRLKVLGARYSRLQQGLTQARAQLDSLREIAVAADPRVENASERVSRFHRRLKELHRQIDVLE